MNTDTPTVPTLSYFYEFEPGDHEGVKRCCEEHGFAVVKQLIDRNHVEALKAAVVREAERRGPIAPGETRIIHAFVEFAPDEQLAFLENEAWLKLQEHVLGSDALTVHRTAAIYKAPGAKPITWHSDWCGFHDGPPRNANDVLNRGEQVSGGWFYLTGTRPEHAGLCIYPDSHTSDWTPPAGYDFTGPDKRMLYKLDDPDRKPVKDIHLPGALPLITEPGDMIKFAARTWHFAGEHQGTEPRLSCGGLGFRVGREPWPVPWDMPQSAKALLARLTPAQRPYFEHYTSIDNDWKPTGH